MSKIPMYLQPQRYIGLRISDVAGHGDDWILNQFRSMEWPNPYFYCAHSPDSGCKHRHFHFVLIRDYDPLRDRNTLSKGLIRQYVSKSELKGNKDFAISFYTETLVHAGNYMVHDPTAKVLFSEGYDWEGLDTYEFKYQVIPSKEVKPDVDIHERRPDLNHIPLTRYNLVATLQRYDRIKKVAKRTFKEALYDLLTNTRYRFNAELLKERPLSREYADEYEQGVHQAAKSFIDRYCPY